MYLRLSNARKGYVLFDAFYSPGPPICMQVDTDMK